MSPRTITGGADLRVERDRYVAFAFAAADLLLEFDAAWRIVAASGAAQAVFGCAPAAMVGRSIGDLIAARDQAFVRQLLATLASAPRIDPVPVRLDHAAAPPVLMGACTVPTIVERAFVTFTLQPTIVGDEPERDPATGLLARDELLAAARRSTVAGGGRRSLALVHLGGLDALRRTLSEQRAQLLMAEIAATLRAGSFGGDAAGRLGDEDFGVVGGVRLDAQALLRNVLQVANDVAGPRSPALETRLAAIDLGAGELDERDAAKALFYAVRRFAEGSDEVFTLTSLKEGLTDSMGQAVARLSGFKRVVRQGELQLVYQPIVVLADRTVHHHEALSRFPDGSNPYEVITFGEETGLIEELDFAVAEMAIMELERVPGAVVAVNVSGRSVQSEGFRRALMGLLHGHQGLRDRLIFELTESSAIERVDEVATLLERLRMAGHRVCLDDFGAGAAAYSYLRHFEVDFVKTDGPFLAAAGTRERERALIRSICRLCAEFGSATIGEMIEDERQALQAAELGIGYGQGWVFGRPAETLTPAAKPPARAAKRKGAVERWE